MQLTPLVRKLKIVDKEARVVSLEPNWAQMKFLEVVEDKLNANDPVRVIVLKARQIGVSTITEAIGFSLAFIFDHMRGLVVAHEIESSQHLLSMTETYWQTYPFRYLYTPRYQSKNELAWRETGSSIKVATARNAKAGRGRTLHFLHASEVGFWEEPDKTMLGLRQTVPQLPNTFICIESTANGVGNWFYNTWMAAENNDVDYIPLFFPWHLHPEYQASNIGLPYFELGNLESEERALVSMGVSYDRLAWRRWAIKNLCDNDINKFHQEYPSTPSEAFIATGMNVFPMPKLKSVYEPFIGRQGSLRRDGNRVFFEPDVAGPLTVYRWPGKDTDWGKYIVGGDPTHTMRGDWACGQVLSRRTMEQVAVYRARIDPGTFGEELAKLGKYYNDALLVPEVEGPGYATVARLIAIDYPYLWFNRVADRTPGKITDHYGWRTTSRSKDLAIGWLLKVVVDESVHIHDKRTFSEMRDYITLPNGGYGPANERGFDDHVMGLAIAVTAHALESPLSAYSGPEKEEPPWEQWGEGMA